MRAVRRRAQWIEYDAALPGLDNRIYRGLKTGVDCGWLEDIAMGGLKQWNRDLQLSNHVSIDG